MLSKKGLTPAVRRELVQEIRQGYQLSENRACGLMGITRWCNRYQSCRDLEGELRMRLREPCWEPIALRLSTLDRDVAAPRLEGEC